MLIYGSFTRFSHLLTKQEQLKRSPRTIKRNLIDKLIKPLETSVYIFWGKIKQNLNGLTQYGLFVESLPTCLIPSPAATGSSKKYITRRDT